MKPNEKLREQILEIADNQIRDRKPTETKQTFERLVKMCYGATDAKICRPVHCGRDIQHYEVSAAL